MRLILANKGKIWYYCDMVPLIYPLRIGGIFMQGKNSETKNAETGGAISNREKNNN